jgi:integrase
VTVPTPPSNGTVPVRADSSASQAPTPSVPYSPKNRKDARNPVDHAAHHSLTPLEVDELLATVGDARDLALLSLAIATGMRREDVVSVKTADYNRERRTISYVEKKKRNRVRADVPLDPKAATRLDLYLGARGRESVWLFPSDLPSSRNHLSSRTAWNVLNRWCRAAGLAPRPFHSLRATCYKLAKARGWPVELAAWVIGDTIRVAQEFYGVATPGEVAAMLRERPLL